LKFPKISIVTPNFNGGKYLEETIKSILNQDYPNLEYIIVDGGSSDRSIEIIKEHESRLTYWVSEPDNGLYDALNKGFSKTNGEIMGWLNSDDMLHPKSLFTLAEIFSLNHVEWIQGMHSWFDEEGRVFRVENVRLKSKYNYLLKDYHSGFSPFIQQESTYWKRTLWERAGGFISTQYKIAGDFELWMRFFKHGEMKLTHSLIGGFRRTGDQYSVQNFQLYYNEADNIIDKYPLSSEENKNLNFLSKAQLADKIPYLKKRRYQRRQSLLNNMEYISWNPMKKKFMLL